MTELAEFLDPLDPAAFRAEYYGKRPVHIRRGGSRPDILDWARFNRALAVTPYWTEETLKVSFRSRPALRDSYCDPSTPGHGARVNPGKLKALTAVGASIVANSIQNVSPEVAEIAHLLEREFAARVLANVYCSFRGVQAFQTHYDLHDVFACQAEGEKTWRVYEARADNPAAPLPPGEETDKWLTESRGRLLFAVTMKPGDVLYLPRGQYHDALTEAQASLHVTFGVAPAIGLSLFKLLESAVTQESAFRAYLPDARDGGELGARLAGLAERAKAVMASPAFALDVLNHQRGLARVPAEYDLPAQQAPVWYVVAAPARVVRRDGGFSVAAHGREIPIGSAQPLVEWMLRQRQFSAQEAAGRQPGLPPAEAREVLQRLIAAGVIAETQMQSNSG